MKPTSIALCSQSFKVKEPTLPLSETSGEGRTVRQSA